MAIDYGITSLDAGAPELTYAGNEGPQDPRAMTDIEKIILQHWLQQGGSYGDDIPEEFRQQIIQIYGLDRDRSAYGGSANPTYTQSRKQRMAYGGTAGADGRRRYGIGSWFQEKIKDPIKEKFVDPAIDFITDNPMLTAIGGGALVNQFGLPDILTRNIGLGENVGQNWVGDLLGGIPGIPSDTVIGNTPEQKAMMKRIGEADVLSKVINPHADTELVKQTQKYTDILNTLRKPNLVETALTGAKNFFTGDGGFSSTTSTTDGKYPVRWKEPLAIGLGIGALESQLPKAQLPQDTSGIDIANIRSRALTGSDPGLHFLPPASATTAYAQGGRIGYQGNGSQDVDPVAEIVALMSKRMKEGLTSDETARLDKLIKATGFMEQKAQGGRIGYDHGGSTLFGDIAEIDWGSNLKDLGSSILDMPGEAWEILKDFPTGIKQIYFNLKSKKEKDDMLEILMGENKAQGGRIGYANAGPVGIEELLKDLSKEEIEKLLEQLSGKVQDAGDMRMASDPGMGEGPFMYQEYLDAVRDGFKGSYDEFIDQIDRSPWDYAAQGGRIGAQEGGLMNLGGMEKDYRQEGGFVPIGGQERADDVPARLSKNEFVFTADAVRAAGGGDIDAGAEVMENVMENLERGGQVSEESQGLEGARNMFATAQRLEGVL